MLFKVEALREYKEILELLEMELLERGHTVLCTLVETPTEVRFAEFFGFTKTPFTTDHNGGQIIMMKDLLHV